MVTYRSVRSSATLKANLRDAARKYVDLAQLQYRAGSINYLDVLDAQRRYFDAQIGVSNAVRDEHLALVNLYKALGGGWTTPEEQSAGEPEGAADGKKPSETPSEKSSGRQSER